MQGSSIEALAARLERENRRWRALAAVLGLCALAAVVVGAALPDDVSARRLALTGADGQPRAVLAVVNDLPSLSFLDDRANTKLTMGVRRDGTPYADMLDVNDDGKLKSRISLGLIKEGAGVLLLRDKAGVPRAGIGVGPNGVANISLSNAKGKDAVWIGTDEDESSRIALFNSNGDPTVAIANSGKGRQPMIYFRDLNGKPRLQITVQENGEPSVTCFDANGNATFRAPTAPPP